LPRATNFIGNLDFPDDPTRILLRFIGEILVEISHRIPTTQGSILPKFREIIEIIGRKGPPNHGSTIIRQFSVLLSSHGARGLDELLDAEVVLAFKHQRWKILLEYFQPFNWMHRRFWILRRRPFVWQIPLWIRSLIRGIAQRVIVLRNYLAYLDPLRQPLFPNLKLLRVLAETNVLEGMASQIVDKLELESLCVRFRRAKTRKGLQWIGGLSDSRPIIRTMRCDCAILCSWRTFRPSATTT
jgi:hypothetical protein